MHELVRVTSLGMFLGPCGCFRRCVHDNNWRLPLWTPWGVFSWSRLGILFQGLCGGPCTFQPHICAWRRTPWLQAKLHERLGQRAEAAHYHRYGCTRNSSMCEPLPEGNAHVAGHCGMQPA